MSKRVNVTVPDEVGELLEWYVKHDPRFDHQAATAAAHFLSEGLRAAYQRGLAEAEPMDPDDYGPLAQHQRDTLTSADE